MHFQNTMSSPRKKQKYTNIVSTEHISVLRLKNVKTFKTFTSYKMTLLVSTEEMHIYDTVSNNITTKLFIMASLLRNSEEP